MDVQIQIEGVKEVIVAVILSMAMPWALVHNTL